MTPIDPAHFTLDDDGAWWCALDDIELRVDSDAHGPRAASLALVENALHARDALMQAALHHLAFFLDRARYDDAGFALEGVHAGIAPCRAGGVALALSHARDTYGRFTVCFAPSSTTPIAFERANV